MSWTEARVDELKQLWADGFSASLIAAEMGGLTRNAVIGKANRIGLRVDDQRRIPTQHRSYGTAPACDHQQRKPRPEKPATPTLRAGFNARRAAELQKTDPAVLALPPDESPDACTIFELTAATCRWPLGEPGLDMLYCGAAHDPEFGSYCARHREIARGKPMQISPEERERRSEQAKNNYRKRMG